MCELVYDIFGTDSYLTAEMTAPVKQCKKANHNLLKLSLRDTNIPVLTVLTTPWKGTLCTNEITTLISVHNACFNMIKCLCMSF